MSNQLSLPFKKTRPIGIKSAVVNYLKVSGTEAHPEAFLDDVNAWERMREESVLTTTVHVTRVDALLRYGIVFRFSTAVAKRPMQISRTIDFYRHKTSTRRM